MAALVVGAVIRTWETKKNQFLASTIGMFNEMAAKCNMYCSRMVQNIKYVAM